MRIGIFGGSFDPSHMAHVWICRNAVKELHLDKLFIIPNFVSPLKREKAVDKEHIVNMCRFLSYEPGCYLDTREIDREGPSFTVDTVKAYRQEYPSDELYLIMGYDAVSTFTNWKDYTVISNTINCFVIVPRMGYEMDEDAHIRALDRPTCNIFLLEPSFVQISSTQLRQMIRDDENIEGLLPIVVQAYILRNKLYL